MSAKPEDAAWPIPKVPVVLGFVRNLVDLEKIDLTVFHVGSLPTACLFFLCGSPLPVILPPRLEAKTVSVVECICHRGFE